MSTLGPRRSLSALLADELRARIQAHQWPAGGQLPTEAELCREYELSRSTVRQALKALESQGLIVIRHGLGSFVASGSAIHAGIQELQSITDTISRQGRQPGMTYRDRVIRTAAETERERLGLPAGAEVLAIQRAILADDTTVAYSYDTLPISVLPPDFHLADLDGSVFGYLERHSGLVAARAVAEVHAVRSDTIGWGEDEGRDCLYVLLDQIHYDLRDRPFMHSMTYFAEGRFNFVVLRTR